MRDAQNYLLLYFSNINIWWYFLFSFFLSPLNAMISFSKYFPFSSFILLQDQTVPLSKYLKLLFLHSHSLSGLNGDWIKKRGKHLKRGTIWSLRNGSSLSKYFPLFFSFILLLFPLPIFPLFSLYVLFFLHRPNIFDLKMPFISLSFADQRSTLFFLL